MSTQEQKDNRFLLQQIIAGFIVLIGGLVITWFLGVLAQANVPIWWYLIGVLIVALGATLIFPPWRAATWGNFAKWRPLTTVATLDRARIEGRAELEAELDQKRHRPIVRAQWLITASDEDEDKWVLRNVADDSYARDVSLLVESQEFQASSRLDWPRIDGNEIENFYGVLTQAAEDFGATFVVMWTDLNEERKQFKFRWDD
ncbi:MAG: hypothetical protein KF692_06340 [Cryobacterium sp.]|nr:hypothetical protein [Cryobacterium sp.]